MYLKTHEILKDKYTQYEISSYLLKGLKIPVHNPVYWEGNRGFFGFGMGASSFVGGVRFNRAKYIKQYYNYVKIID